MLRWFAGILGGLVLGRIFYKIAEFVGNRLLHFSELLKKIAAFLKRKVNVMNRRAAG